MSAPHEDESLLDAAIRFDNLPAKGRHLKVEATDSQRAAVSSRFNLESVEKLRANLLMTPMKGGIEVRGTLRAAITQLCIVTFAPVNQAIEEEFTRIFLQGSAKEAESPAGSEVFVDLEGDDLPDYFEGSEVDFSELILEILVLAIDTYPRAPDAVVPETGDGGDIESVSPPTSASLIISRTRSTSSADSVRDKPTVW